MLILSLFPGADLFGQGMEREFRKQGVRVNIVRGPDLLYGSDVRDFDPIPGIYDAIIGGPPCQKFSSARFNQDTGVNLIPEFVRIVEKAKPRWAIMENVVPARKAAPDWPSVTFKDWDVGGKTHRRRSFWFYGIDAPKPPEKRPGAPAYSVLATSWKARNNKPTYPKKSVEESADLQGFPEVPTRILSVLPTPSGKAGMTQYSKNCFIIHLLGNGVPAAMSAFLANHVIFELGLSKLVDSTQEIHIVDKHEEAIA